MAGVSSKIEILWYDAAQAAISTSAVQVTDTTTTAALRGGSFAAPANAAYAKVRVTGGVPTVGTSGGTVYVDGCVFGQTIAGNLIKFTRITASNASWAPQFETRRIVVRCVGGGGNGGSGGADLNGGVDGMDGVEAWGYTDSITAQYSVTVGASATASSFGSVVSAAGGANGANNCSYYLFQTGASGQANSGHAGNGGNYGGAGGTGVVDVWEYA
ncbi:MAG: WAG22 antigen [Gallionellaceae bacterium]|nr:MAG: WAG22 antigen [Gallionellaceae bacterium]